MKLAFDHEESWGHNNEHGLIFPNVDNESVYRKWYLHARLGCVYICGTWYIIFFPKNMECICDIGVSVGDQQYLSQMSV